MPDGGNSTERSQLEIGIGCARPMRAVVDPHRDGADERTCELRQRIANNVAEVSTNDGKTKRDRWIEVGGTATGEGGENAGDDGKRPASGDGEPASVFTLRSFQQDAGHNAVAEQNQDRCSEKLSKHRVGSSTGEYRRLPRPESIDGYSDNNRSKNDR